MALIEAMTYQTLSVAHAADIAVLTFNRPEKRNAISPEMIEELLAALDEIEHGPARVAILTGAGKAFCSGMDLEVLQTLAAEGSHHHLLKDGPLKGGIPRPSDANLADSRRMAHLFRRLYDFPKTLIAAVNGAAIAGGCGIATLCDFTLAVPEARFGYTEVRIGFIPALVSVFLIRQIGEKRARDLLLTGRVIDAAEALRIGLITEIVTAELLLDRARQLASQLLENSPTSLAYTRGLLTEFSKAEVDHQLALALEENARIRSTADFREG
ncbi:MAG TPA: enoyl-CoA hydratase/isomerase family protein, partial [Terriglobia bacterium]|nr:enoyl-CoA hydratase/isomerase family protein [Terriglobia bacterium]